MNGTRYNNAGWAALNTSDDTVAVNKPANTVELQWLEHLRDHEN